MRFAVVPPTAITRGSLAGEPIVPETPESPLEATTVTPALIAARSARVTGSVSGSGYGFPPKDSLRMSTLSWFTA